MVEAGAGLGIGMMLPGMMNQQQQQQQRHGNTTVVTAASFCTKCGNGLRDEDRFCGGCGQPVDGGGDSGNDQED
jgi:predicted amidophosphoribosyltransferase